MKKYYLEVLRLIAIIMVLLIHVVAIPMDSMSRGGEFIVYNICYSIGCLGVPIFLMISGSLLLDQNYQTNINKIYKHSIPRLIVPLVFYGMIYACLEIYYENRSIVFLILPKSFVRVINNESWAHLWYLYMLIGLYILLPIIRYILLSDNKTITKYFLGILLVFGYIVPTINNIAGLKMDLNMPMPLCHILSLCVGHYIDVNKEDKYKKIIYIFGSICLTILIVYACIPLIFENVKYAALARYDGLFVLGSAALIFQFIKNKVHKERKIVVCFSKASFGIYLIHPVIMNVLYKVLNIQPTMFPALLAIPAFTICFFFPAWLIVIICKRIPVIKTLV